ncbi:MAG: DNA-formamidopyrimidine glycosylase family protein [Chryseolinea sp.]
MSILTKSLTMPEGPSIIILKEAVYSFAGQKVVKAEGNSRKVDFDRLTSARIIEFKSWGKHFLICFKGFTIRIHFLLFGSYRINEDKADAAPRLSLKFSKGKTLNFYACSISILDQPLNEVYDWTNDVMNDQWDEKKALQKLKKKPDALACDVLLDQQIFSGVGNIIKNEVLFRIRVHPQSKIGKLPLLKRKLMVKEAVHYSFQFLEWKKEFALKKHWLAHTKKICPRDQHPIVKDYMGITNRRTFYCKQCQKLYV